MLLQKNQTIIKYILNKKKFLKVNVWIMFALIIFKNHLTAQLLPDLRSLLNFLIYFLVSDEY